MSKVTIETGAEVETALSDCSLPANAPEAAGRGALIARAPVSLDVMGGIAEQTGATVLTTPMALFAMAAVKGRDDQKLCLKVVSADHRKSANSERVWPLAALYSAPNVLHAPAQFIEVLGYYHGGGSGNGAVKKNASRELSLVETAVLSVVYVLLADHRLAHLADGINIAVEAPTAAGVEAIAAIQAATAAAVAMHYELDVDRSDLADCCRKAHALFFEPNGGAARHFTSVAGQPGVLLQVCGATKSLVGLLEMPAGIELIGIDSGAWADRAEQKHDHSRVTSLMGRDLIRRIAANSNGDLHGFAANWDGLLAHLSVTDYVDHIRDRIPTKVKGAAFIDHFGQLDEDGAKVDPAATYKVRSRAEHHIYEHERVRQFAERIARAVRNNDRTAAAEAGELMYASHWSYGQRCGLGSIQTDLLVNLLRRHGEGKGVLGARICGPGAGGCVVAMVESTDQAKTAVTAALDEYRAKSGCKHHLMQGGRGHSRPFAVYRNV